MFVRASPVAGGGRTVRVGRGYWVWLVAAVVSDLGSNVMTFGLAWVASGLGGSIAGLVATSTMLFRVLFLVVGGSLGDRFGPRTVMIVSDAAMAVVTAGVAVWFFTSDVTVGSLLALGSVLGIASAFYIPASGVFPRLFVDESQLPRVMATTSSGLQVSRLTGPALGGVLIGAFGLAWVTAINTISFLVVLVVLLAVVPPRRARPESTDHLRLREALARLRAAGNHRLILGLLAALAILSASAPPSLLLSVPLLARDKGWTSAQTGLVEAAFMTSALVVGLTVAARGAMAEPARPLIGGLIIAALGLVILGLAPSVVIACAGGAVIGVGSVLFAAHAMPAFLAASPPGLQTRLQALLGLAQTLPALIFTNIYGAIAQHWSPQAALITAGGLLLTAAAVLLANTDTRSLELPTATT